MTMVRGRKNFTLYFIQCKTGTNDVFWGHVYKNAIPWKSDATVKMSKIWGQSELFDYISSKANVS